MTSAPSLTEADASDWVEFCRWMESDPNTECLYIWLSFTNGTFFLSEEEGKKKALERFRVWQLRKQGIAQARVQLTLVPKVPRPKLTLDLKDLLP